MDVELWTLLPHQWWLLLAHLSTKCSWWTVVVSQCPSSIVRAMSTIALKTYSSYTQLTRYLVGSSGVTYRSKIAKIVPIGNPRWRHLENLFFVSSPEPKGQLTPNLLGSIRVTCRSKIDKIVPIGNPRWPLWWPSWKSIFRFFSWTERPIDSSLARKHRGDL